MAYDHLNGGGTSTANFYNGATALALTASSDSDTRTTLNGYFKFDALKLGAGWLNRKAETKTVTNKQDTTWLQADMPMGQVGICWCSLPCSLQRPKQRQ